VNFPQLAQIGFIAFACAGVYGFVTAARDGETRRACSALCAMRPSYAGRNRLAPDFELASLGGGKVRLSQFRGKTVIINFWTKTCRPCLEEMPSLASLGKALSGNDKVVLMTISTDETLEDARATLQSVLTGAPPFLVLLDPESKVVADTYGTKLYPETWFIDPNGVIRARFDGGRDWGNALTVDLAESLAGPIPCEASFLGGQPTEATKGVCADLDHE
jgi:thiol-disulfide isomerase/thioredoxin